MNDGHRVLHDLTEQPQYGLHLKRYSDSWISELCAGAAFVRAGERRGLFGMRNWDAEMRACLALRFY